jgi:hypothetical protein
MIYSFLNEAAHSGVVFPVVGTLLALAGVRPSAADGFQTTAPFALVEDYESGAGRPRSLF